MSGFNGIISYQIGFGDGCKSFPRSETSIVICWRCLIDR